MVPSEWISHFRAKVHFLEIKEEIKEEIAVSVRSNQNDRNVFKKVTVSLVETVRREVDNRASE